MRAILVAGCSTGYGYRSARELARRGHHVFAGLREPEGRNAERAAELRHFAREGGLRLETVHLDVDADTSVDECVRHVLGRTDGRLDVLVNGAAYGVMGPLEACRPEQLLDELNTNVVGALRLFRAVLPAMRAHGKGRVVQITSGLGRAALPFMGPFAVSAWALECFAEVLAIEAQPFGIDVAILEPAAYRTELGGPSVKPVGDEERLGPYLPQLVAFAEKMWHEDPAVGDPEEVARAVADAVEAETVELRTPVGASARELIALREGRTTGEFHREILERTGQLPFTKKR